MKIKEWLLNNGNLYDNRESYESLIRDCAYNTGRTIKSVKEVIRDNEMIFYNEVVTPATFTSPIRSLSDCREIVFAIASDLHFGSKECQITALNEFCAIAKASGVKHILVPGDVVAGCKVYAGQAQDIYCSDAEDQEASVLANLPDGFDWYMLAGNHDYDYVKRTGHNPVEQLAIENPSIHYLGNDMATIPLMPGVDAQLWHPSGGVPYSYSYRLQKGIESYSLQSLHNNIDHDRNVKFFIAGHLHIQMQGMFGSVFGCQAGAFEGTTNYLKRKGYYSNVGGYIIKATLKAGNILQFEAPFHLFPEIKDDYKNYKHTLPQSSNIIDPLF